LLDSPVEGVVIFFLLFKSLLSFGLDRFRTAGILALVGVVVPGSGGGSKRGGESPDVVLGFVDSSATEELLLDIPVVESVSHDGLHNNGSNSNDHLDDHNRHAVVIGRVRGQSSRSSSSNLNNEEDPPNPEEGAEVPGVDVGKPVESVNDR